MRVGGGIGIDGERSPESSTRLKRSLPTTGIAAFQPSATPDHHAITREIIARFPQILAALSR